MAAASAHQPQQPVLLNWTGLASARHLLCRVPLPVCSGPGEVKPESHTAVIPYSVTRREAIHDEIRRKS